MNISRTNTDKDNFALSSNDLSDNKDTDSTATIGTSERIRSITDRVRAAIYPDRCCFCGKVIKYKTELCDSCRKIPRLTAADRCFACGRNINECNCKGHANFYEAVTAPYRYMGVVKKGVGAWKFLDEETNVVFFGKAVAETVADEFYGVKFDFICFIPQTKDEMKVRGYNQSEVLACEIGKNLNIPLRPLLTKVFKTKRQHELPWYMKTGNVFGVFDCIDKNAIEGKTILLTDDIKTTGTTLNECAKVLNLYGAEKVYCAVFAVT